MDVGTTVEVEFSGRSDGHFKAERDGHQFSIAGKGSIGDSRNVRVVKKQESTFIAVTEGASLRLRIDEVVDDSTVKADPSYGPVFIQAPLTRGDWWRCIVTSINKNHIIAENTKYIPRNSDIEKGPIPEDPTQSLNNLISGKKL